MYGQALDNDEVLNLRWATDDPDPKVIEIVKRHNEAKVLKAIEKNMPKVGEKGSVLAYQNHYEKEQETPKRSIEATENTTTKKIKADETCAETANALSSEEYAKQYEQYYAQYYAYYNSQEHLASSDPNAAYAYSYDNSAFAYPSDDAAQPVTESPKSPKITAKSAPKENSTTQPPIKSAGSLLKSGIDALAAYASDEE